MALFDLYLMVDWSARDQRCGGRHDCIWIASGSISARSPHTLSPLSRSEAEQFIRAQLQAAVRAKQRVLVCCDFGYGYPAGFATLLGRSVDNELLPWRFVWQYLSEHVKDDIGTAPREKPSNRSNRFDVASAINAAASMASSTGPFWSLSKPGSYVCVPQRRPVQPFVCSSGSIASLRITDQRVGSDTPFRLFGTGSVGSQVLTGIPRLHSIRFDRQFANCSAVWPFETGWAAASDSWLDLNVRILHAEIYPSVRSPLTDTIKDRGQVRAMWHWARDLDSQDLLLPEFAIPPGISSGSPEDVVIRNEEGWILGCKI